AAAVRVVRAGQATACAPGDALQSHAAPSILDCGPAAHRSSTRRQERLPVSKTRASCPRGNSTAPLSAQWSEARAQLFDEELRLLPGGEVAAPVDLVEVREVGVDRLDPAARGSPELAGERREADRNRDRRRSLAGRTGCGLVLWPTVFLDT